LNTNSWRAKTNYLSI